MLWTIKGRKQERSSEPSWQLEESRFPPHPTQTNPRNDWALWLHGVQDWGPQEVWGSLCPPLPATVAHCSRAHWARPGMASYKCWWSYSVCWLSNALLLLNPDKPLLRLAAVVGLTKFPVLEARYTVFDSWSLSHGSHLSLQMPSSLPEAAFGNMDKPLLLWMLCPGSRALRPCIAIPTLAYHQVPHFPSLTCLSLR